MTLKGTCEIEEADKTEETDQTEAEAEGDADAPEIRRSIEVDSPTPSMSATLHERIATRAFEIYERRIRQGPLDDWLRAELEILRRKKIRNADMPHPHRGGYAGEEQD